MLLLLLACQATADPVDHKGPDEPAADPFVPQKVRDAFPPPEGAARVDGLTTIDQRTGVETDTTVLRLSRSGQRCDQAHEEDTHHPVHVAESAAPRKVHRWPP